jgi:hypothetical protein
VPPEPERNGASPTRIKNRDLLRSDDPSPWIPGGGLGVWGTPPPKPFNYRGAQLPPKLSVREIKLDAPNRAAVFPEYQRKVAVTFFLIYLRTQLLRANFVEVIPASALIR